MGKKSAHERPLPSGKHDIRGQLCGILHRKRCIGLIPIMATLKLNDKLFKLLYIPESGL